MWLITQLQQQQQYKYVVVSQVFAATQPLSCLFVHDQRDVALDQGEGEEADVAGVLAGCSALLWTLERERHNTQCGVTYSHV